MSFLSGRTVNPARRAPLSCGEGNTTRLGDSTELEDVPGAAAGAAAPCDPADSRRGLTGKLAESPERFGFVPGFLSAASRVVRSRGPVCFPLRDDAFSVCALSRCT